MMLTYRRWELSWCPEFFYNSCYLEQLLVEPSLSLSFWGDDSLPIACDKHKFCDHPCGVYIFKPHTCAEVKHVIHITSTNDDLMERSFVVYIKFSTFSYVLCTISLENNQRRGPLFINKERMMRAWHACIRPWFLMKWTKRSPIKM